MSLGRKLGVNRPFNQVERSFLPNLLDFYRQPARYRLAPFKIAGNLYYVGDKKVCSHLIDTGDGLILFDGGYQHSVHLLLNSIWELGFNPHDIKYFIISHGHFDHFGAAAEFREIFGCRLYLSRVDVEMLRENPAAALMEYSPCPYASIPKPDVLIEDGSEIALGNTSIECVLSPGHTPGTMSFFFDVHAPERTYRAGYFGGIGFLSLFRDFLVKYGQPADMQQQFCNTIKKLRRRPVDIVLGNHPYHNGTLEKREYMRNNPDENPFIDNSEWSELLDALQLRLDDFMSKSY